MPDQLPLVMLGAGGHARVLRALLSATGQRLAGVCDPQLAAQDQAWWDGVPVLGADEALLKFAPDQVAVVNGLGQLVAGAQRAQVFARFSALGYRFPALAHPAAWLAEGVVLDPGVQVMAGVVVQPGCTVGANSILNTRAGIDHDCRIGADVHIAPGATLCGGVSVEGGAFVGAGATVIQGISIGAGAVVGAGVTVVRNIGNGVQVLGAPVRIHRQLPASI